MLACLPSELVRPTDLSVPNYIEIMNYNKSLLSHIKMSQLDETVSFWNWKRILANGLFLLLLRKVIMYEKVSHLKLYWKEL